MGANAAFHRTSSAAGGAGSARARLDRRLVLVATAAALTVLGLVPAASAKPPAGSGQPDFGPNVLIFDPSMPTSQIQAAVDAIAAQQVPNQFGPQRYALLFKPGTYGTAANPLNFQVGYYTSRRRPRPVAERRRHQRLRSTSATSATARLLHRAEQLLALAVEPDDQRRTRPNFGCYNGEFWAGVAGGADAPRPRQRVRDADGLLHRPVVRERRLHRRLERSTAATIVNGSQQQWLVRNSTLDGWTNGVWNQVFSGVVGAPAQCFPAQPSCGGPYTTLPTSPVTREAPYLYVDADGHYNVFVPAAQRDSVGHDVGRRADRRHVDPDRRSSSSPSRRTTRRRSTTRSRAGRT